jgi:hypothetical protein
MGAKKKGQLRYRAAPPVLIVPRLARASLLTGRPRQPRLSADRAP